jgi:2-haloacid dehalogenase
LSGLPEAEVARFNRVWHRLRPWPDAVPGLERLRRRFVVAPLSNGNFALLTNMAKHAGLPWDCVLSAELFGAYKPAPEVYRGAVALLGLEPGEAMMVAAHPGDLRAAGALGLRTAYVPRPGEFGPGAPPPPPPDDTFDLVADGFVDLAGRLSATSSAPEASQEGQE